MNFISLIYGIFLIVILSIYWSVGNESKSMKSWLILIFSLIFYASLQIRYLPLLLIITLLNFRIGKAMALQVAQGAIRAKNPNLSNEAWQKLQGMGKRRTTQLLCLGISLNILLLLGFKYIPFILNSLTVILNLELISNTATWFDANLMAPLGISFFVFECIAYLVDVYRGAPATKNLIDFASYKFFFPKLISGPITRYHYFNSQQINQQIPLEQWVEGLWLIACGALKKALLADHLAIFVDLCFGNLERASSYDLWLAILAYGLQLYLDFSGYVDIARGSAKLLGFNLPENFDFPYFTTSIANFWRRWHISLGDWLRNYLYFPLGGSRKGLIRTCINLFLVMLIAGIWHGAAWGYVIWGCLHGIALVVHRLVENYSEKSAKLTNWWQSFPGKISAWLITQLMVFLAWVCFRLPNLQQAGLVYQHLFNYDGDIQFVQKVYQEALALPRLDLTLLLAALVSLMSLGYLVQRQWQLQLNWHLKLLLVPLCLYVIWIFAPEGGLPYIYFDF